jgi:hypothetical protein
VSTPAGEKNFSNLDFALRLVLRLVLDQHIYLDLLHRGFTQCVSSGTTVSSSFIAIRANVSRISLADNSGSGFPLGPSGLTYINPI